MFNIRITILILMTLVLAACGGGGGGSSGGAVGIVVPTPAATPAPIHQYDLYMDGQTGWFASVIYTNWDTNDVVETPFQVNNISAQGAGITKFGTNLFGQIVNRGAVDVTFRIVRDGVEIYSVVMAPGSNQISFIYDY